MAGFKNNVLGGIKRWFQGFLGKVLDFLNPLAETIVKNGGPVLLAIVQEAVFAAESTGGSGKDKLKAAQDKIESELKAKAMPVVWNAINGAIEAAVAKLKSNA